VRLFLTEKPHRVNTARIHRQEIASTGEAAWRLLEDLSCMHKRPSEGAGGLSLEESHVEDHSALQSPRKHLLRSLGITLEMIKWEHSVFALPFALTGAVLAANGWPRAIQLFWIVVCMVTARSAAMAFNRWADADLDAANPRTAARAIPAGLLSRGFVGAFTVVMALLFVFSASRLNRLSLELSPVALAVLLGYSYMKRITRWSHLVLGGRLRRLVRLSGRGTRPRRGSAQHSSGAGRAQGLRHGASDARRDAAVAGVAVAPVPPGADSRMGAGGGDGAALL
jgi:hypothetical protein